MCIRVQFASCAKPRIFDAETGVITLPDTVSSAHTVTAVRAVLSELAAPQPELGAVCWCGDPIVWLPRIPQQRRSEQVIWYGA